MAAAFHVKDVEASLRFYTEVLGFQKWFAYGDGPLEAAGVQRGDGRLIISRQRNGEPVHSKGTGLYFVLTPAELEAVHAELKSRLPDLQPIVKRPWGDSTFYVSDPDGYDIEFATES